MSLSPFRRGSSARREADQAELDQVIASTRSPSARRSASTNTVAVTDSTFAHWGDGGNSGVIFATGSQGAKANVTLDGDTISDPLRSVVTGLVAFLSHDGVSSPPSIWLDLRDSVALAKGMTVSNSRPGTFDLPGYSSGPVADYWHSRNPAAGAFTVNASTPAVLHPQGVASCPQP